MEYDLSRLGHGLFASLARDVVRNVLGIDVRDHLDLGASFSGHIGWPAGSTQQIWEGTTYFKSLFVEPGPTSDHNISFAISEMMKEEHRAWLRLAGQNAGKHNQIDNLLYIVNVRLDDIVRSDFDARLKNAINTTSELGIKVYKVWHYDQLSQMLDKQDSIREKYASFISPDNVLTSLDSYIVPPAPAFGEVISRHLTMDLIADQWIRLSQVGLSNRNKLPLSSVAIDLPIERIGASTCALAHILTVGNRLLRPSYRASIAGSTSSVSSNQPEPPHLVLLGGPGQGKTTIGQLVCQVYRAALLSDGPQLPQEASSLLLSVRDSLARMGLQEPSNRRWPLRIELSAYADAAIGISGVALLSYIAQHVSSRISEEINPSTMRAWLHDWPWLLILDGLDEVASQRARDVLMQRISEFFVEAAQADCDLLVVATTRPQGYTGEFSADRYQHLALSPLAPVQAASYAERLAEVQHASDPDLMKKVVRRTHIASQEGSTARLMRSPLQVTIMSLLLENRERAPQARYALFEEYYRAIYFREAAKPGEIGRLLEELRPHINALHDRLGLLLQVQAEQAGDSDAALPQNELRALSLLRLDAEGFESLEAERLADQIVKAVTQRLVLIVPKALDEVGFEVRSIQEFMAARALTTGKDTAVLARLKLCVPSAHWRNTWLFAAGRIFSDREHLRRDLIAVVEDTDNLDVLNVVVAPGADLALDLLDDDLTVGSPVLQRVLARHALTLLRCPPDTDLRRRADILVRCANMDSVVLAATEQAIVQALVGSVSQRYAAEQLLGIWGLGDGNLSLWARRIPDSERIREARSSKQRDQAPYISVMRTAALVLDEESLEPSERLLAERLISVGLTADDRSRVEAGGASSDINECLSRSACATAVGRIVLALAAQPTHYSTFIGGLLRNWLSRTPSGAELIRVTPFPDHIANPQ